MSYKIRSQPAFKQNIKGFKNNKTVLDELKTAVTSILEMPLSGEKLSGSWAGFRKIAFGTKPEYRLVYALYDCCKTDNDGIKQTNDANNECDYTDGNELDCFGFIDFVMFKKREDFNTLYKKNKKFTDAYRL